MKEKRCCPKVQKKKKKWNHFIGLSMWEMNLRLHVKRQDLPAGQNPQQQLCVTHHHEDALFHDADISVLIVHSALQIFIVVQSSAMLCRI